VDRVLALLALRPLTAGVRRTRRGTGMAVRVSLVKEVVEQE
jgi:hypothetical protein